MRKHKQCQKHTACNPTVPARTRFAVKSQKDNLDRCLEAIRIHDRKHGLDDLDTEYRDKLRRELA